MTHPHLVPRPARLRARQGFFVFANFFKLGVDNRPPGWYNNSRRKTRNQTCGGLAQLGERLHGMQEVSGSIPLFSTKKALYFVGSMVLFFFVPAKRSGVHRSPCRRASDTPDLHNSRHLPCRFNRGFRQGLRRQHGAGPTAPAPAWQALAEAPAVRQRGRRNTQPKISASGDPSVQKQKTTLSLTNRPEKNIILLRELEHRTYRSLQGKAA